MKRSGFSLALALLFAISVTQAAPGGHGRNQNDPNKTARSFNGIVMDSGCAQLGSHAQMETQHKMTPSKSLTGDEARKCADACVQAGAKYVLYNPANKTTYQLSDQDKAKEYAGESVRVNGSYDAASKTITVENIAKRSSTTKR